MTGAALGTSTPIADFAGNRRFHAHVNRGKAHGEIVGKADNFTDLDARSKLNFVPRHARPARHFHDVRADIELLQRPLNRADVIRQFGLRPFCAGGRSLRQQGQGRQNELGEGGSDEG